MAEKEKKAKEVATPNGFIYEIARVAARIVLWFTGGYPNIVLVFKPIVKTALRELCFLAQLTDRGV